MSRGRQYIELEGLFSENVLGIFRVIRGFADLGDLAAVSVPYRMEDGGQGFRVVDHQGLESVNHSKAPDIPNRVKSEIIGIVRSAGASL